MHITWGYNSHGLKVYFVGSVSLGTDTLSSD